MSQSLPSDHKTGSKHKSHSDKYHHFEHDTVAAGRGRRHDRHREGHRGTSSNSEHSVRQESRGQEHQTSYDESSSTKVSRAGFPADVRENSRSRSTIRKHKDNHNHADGNEKTHSTTHQSHSRSSDTTGQPSKQSRHSDVKQRTPTPEPVIDSRSRTRSSSRAPKNDVEVTDKLIVQTIEDPYSPKNTTTTNGELEYVVVGDLHGEYEALIALLDGIHYKPKIHKLVLVGDLMGEKIEGSLKIVDLARAVKAIVIRGNHEDWLLHVKERKTQAEDTNDCPNEKFIRYGLPLRTPKPNEKKQYEALGKEATGLLPAYEEILNEVGLAPKELYRRRMEFFNAMPHLLIMTNVGGYNRIGVSHAGINPYLDLMKQHPIVVMNIKSVNPEDETCSWLGREDKERNGLAEKERKKLAYMEPDLTEEEVNMLVDKKFSKTALALTPWHEVWNKKQRHLRRREGTAIIYGHDSKNGLQEHRFSYGIDTGVHRDKIGMGILTALIINSTECGVKQVRKDGNGWVLKE
ncbi:calcineurin-like phosphoesterase protein [Rutstroemia sp. NJR-2017a WRK4]|nr:calcineurin-like phosphoesterase protein [Rutstroemia sp. NJR-2017a WRK4]